MDTAITCQRGLWERPVRTALGGARGAHLARPAVGLKHVVCALAVAAAVGVPVGVYAQTSQELSDVRSEWFACADTLAAENERLMAAMADTPEGDALTAANAYLGSGRAMPAAMTEAPDSIMGNLAAIEGTRDAIGDTEGRSQEAWGLYTGCLAAQKEAALASSRAAAAPSIEAAEALVQDADYGLAEEGARGRLEAALALSRLMARDDLTWQASQVDSAASDLAEATGTVKGQVEEAVAKRAAEAAEAAAAARGSYGSQASAAAAAPAGATTYRASDGTWHIDYTNAYGTASADNGGGVTQWADGYYIAHNWSAAGAKISAGTQYVEVDGKRYRLAGSREVSRDTTWEQVEGWVHANGGIGMQTCVDGGGYLINHYEPVG